MLKDAEGRWFRIKADLLHGKGEVEGYFPVAAMGASPF